MGEGSRRIAWLCAFACALVASAQTAHAESVETLTLAGALTIARARAADVRLARARKDAAAAEADAALAGYLPSLSGQANGSQTWARTSGLDPTPGAEPVDRSSRQQGDLSAAVRWTPFDFGQTPSHVGAARADARAAMYRAVAGTYEVERAVAATYLNVVFDEQLVENAKVTVKIRERHAAIVHAQVGSGVRTTVDEGRARVELELARLELTTTERQSAIDKIRLATLLMMPPTTPLKLAIPVRLATAATSNPTHAAALAIQNRPEVHASANDVIAREESLTASKLARLPTIGVSLELAHHSPLGDRDPRFAKETALAGSVNMTVPLFDWHVWGRIPVAEGNVAVAEAERTGVVQRVRGEAAETTIAVNASRSLLEQSRAIQELAGATLAVLEARYQSGLATTTDLFDGATRDAEARRGTLRAELELALANVQALLAVGRISELER